MHYLRALPSAVRKMAVNFVVSKSKSNPAVSMIKFDAQLSIAAEIISNSTLKSATFMLIFSASNHVKILKLGSFIKSEIVH